MAQEGRRRTLADIFELPSKRAAKADAVEDVPPEASRDATPDVALASPPQSPRPSVVTYATGATRDGPKEFRGRSGTGLITLDTTSDSRDTTHDSDSDDDRDEDFYVQVPLASKSYTHDSLRSHLLNYKAPKDLKSHRVLHGVANDEKFLSKPTLFPTISGLVPDRSNFTHHDVFDIGADGAPLPVEVSTEEAPSNALQIWNIIKDVNKSGKERKAVGRITTIQEPSPALFGAIHHVMNEVFDVDELFHHLVSVSRSSANMHRAFEADERKRRSFVFNFEYFTIVAKDCQPMSWQMAAKQHERKDHHIPITRCSSVVALWLGGEPVRKMKNRARRRTTDHGYAYDPFAPWHVLNVQCYPDWVASVGPHDSTKNYVNGIEAFLVTLLAEFRNALVRFKEIYHAVTALMTPPLDFIFDSDVRDKLLFEDKHFTYSRRYFWGYQTLDIVNDAIKGIIDAYEETFIEEVWDGKHKSLWPLLEEDSPKNKYFRKRMASLRKRFAVEIKKFRKQMDENEEKRMDIKGLREELFVGTSIQESRKSVENTEIAIQQGHNIKLLTLITIVFVPLTFVTSVFGMTNMPTEHRFGIFAVVTAAVCVPFFVLIGSLNTTSGMRFWREQFVAIAKYIGTSIKWLGSGGKSEPKPGAVRKSSTFSSSRRLSGAGDGAPAWRLERWMSAQSTVDAGPSAETGIAGPAKLIGRPFFWQRRKSSRIAEMWNAESLGKM